MKKVIPVAEDSGVKLALHPDDPPFSLLGLPRIVSTEKDLQEVIEMQDSESNGLTFCTGSLGVRADNDLPGMIERFGYRINFLHLRNIKRLENNSFVEADHLGGDIPMDRVMEKVILEQKKRKKQGRDDVDIPVRPDHGFKMLDDLKRNTYPGYPAIGRLKGLAQLEGLELGIKRNLD